MSISVTLLSLFLIALVLSLVITPVIRAAGFKLGAVDLPSERKVHTEPIPRIGGLAVVLSFIIASLIGNHFFPTVSGLYNLNFNTFMGHLGGLIVFHCGLWDDFRRMKPWPKLFWQIAAATVAFIGGAMITDFSIFGVGIAFNMFFSYLITVFWFVLFINAVNLIDGLDGLAGGLVFFTCLIMIISLYINGDYLAAFYFAVLGGAVLGFLKYNFNPATIFLGDGGSYFLGYTIALLAIRSSSKSEVGVLMLIPLLALGVPIFDSILSPIRRFIRGRSMFQPDKGHIHHMLISMGLSSRNAVWLIYGITMVLCMLAIIMITFRGNTAKALILAVLLFGMIFLVRKLGYLEYLAFDKFYGWFQDMTDVSGLSQHRRSFLSMQIAINKSRDMNELWENVVDSLKLLRFNAAQLRLANGETFEWNAQDTDADDHAGSAGVQSSDSGNDERMLRMEIPLEENGHDIFLGHLILSKDLKQAPIKPYTIRRIEHLRRTVIPNLKRLLKV
jgi:UDP-GlcNAc:undecaprenyl-phosphate GlcNAc-1-phosphate transferase